MNMDNAADRDTFDEAAVELREDDADFATSLARGTFNLPSFLTGLAPDGDEVVDDCFGMMPKPTIAPMAAPNKICNMRAD